MTWFARPSLPMPLEQREEESRDAQARRRRKRTARRVAAAQEAIMTLCRLQTAEFFEAT